MKKVFLAALALAWLFASSHAATLHVDALDASAEGWTTGGGLVAHRTTGGASGGFAELASFSHLAAYNSDARWTGSYSAISATEVRADLMAPATSPALQIRLVLFGPGEPRFADRWTSAMPHMIPNDGVWRRYTFSLAEVDLIAPGNPGAVHATLLGGVSRLMFRHDAGAPNHTLDDGEDAIEGTLGLDNVELAMAATEPTPGDFNGDGFVDAEDLDDPVDGWRARFGQDLDGNAFLDWQRNLASAPPSSLAAVPEPEGIALAASAAALVYLVTRTLDRDSRDKQSREGAIIAERCRFTICNSPTVTDLGLADRRRRTAGER